MKKFKLISILLIWCLICGFTVYADDTQSVTSIKATVSDYAMIVGETQRINVYITPSNAENYELQYYSSDSNIVTAAIGTVIANCEGTAEITVKVKDTDISDTFKITVKKSKINPVIDIEPYKDTIYLDRYEETEILYDIVPENADDQGVTFESLNTTVATVTAKGIVYAKKYGSTRIKLSADNGNVIRYVTISVTDDEEYDYSDNEDDIEVRRVTIYDGELEVKRAVEIMATQTKQFTAEIYPDTATDKRIRWKTSDERIAEVDENGIVKGIKAGETKIYAVSRDNGRQDYITVKIIPYVRYPDSISISPQESAVFETGNTVKFNVTYSPIDTTERNIKWSVYPSGAIVDGNGNVTISESGKYTVKAYSSNYKQYAVYEFEAKYNPNHFALFSQNTGVKDTKPIIILFDTDINSYQAQSNIFVTTDEAGNGEKISAKIEVFGNKLVVSPYERWNEGEKYIFIKSGLCDINGNKLSKNIKYKFIVRRNGFEKN